MTPHIGPYPIPMVKITLDGMRLQIGQHFAVNAEPFQKEVDRIIQDAINHFDVQSEVRRIVREVMIDTVRASVCKVVQRIVSENINTIANAVTDELRKQPNTGKWYPE